MLLYYLHIPPFKYIWLLCIYYIAGGLLPIIALPPIEIVGARTYCCQCEAAFNHLLHCCLCYHSLECYNFHDCHHSLASCCHPSQKQP
jgi:hypothetical protein